ncbi:MAG: IMP cyclohydrolase [Oscillospiraceae bacterium]|nr:IMP cyclohydrolase [Oscillospiraceae bacterium]
MTKNIFDLLSKNSYPGRGIIVGKSYDGIYAVIAYFIMGRSENSRNRVFLTDGDGIITAPFDKSKMTEPSLVIYTPVKNIDDKIIVTNGDQTDTIYEFLQKGQGFEDALNTRTFEPDPPILTPRISALLDFENGFSYKMGILKSCDEQGGGCNRFYYNYSKAVSGTGHFIHTYMSDGNPLPTFEGEPVKISLIDDIDDYTNMLWKSLNYENKVSLFVRYVNLKSKNSVTKIINKNVI